jgi:hypothetical protein
MTALNMISLRLLRKASPFCEEATVIARKTVSFRGKTGAAPTNATKKGGESDDRRIGKSRKHSFSDTEPGSSAEDPATQRDNQARSIKRQKEEREEKEVIRGQPAGYACLIL